MKKFIYITILIIPIWAYAQVNTNAQGFKTKAIILGQDTLPLIDLPEAQIWAYWAKATTSSKTFEEWTRTKYNVKKVYPYAILASAILQEMDNKLSQIKDKKQRKIFIKQCEKELKSRFEDDLKNLSVTQGKILMKLIYRETGKTTYEIVKEMRGGLEASMWQALAYIFGNSMKVKYDPYGEDFMVEKAVQLVEKGYF